MGAPIARNAAETKLNTNSRQREHVDERIDAEQVNLTANQITDSRLRDSEALRHLLLRQVLGANVFFDSAMSIARTLRLAAS